MDASPPGFCLDYLKDSGSRNSDLIRLIFLILFVFSVLGLVFIATTIMYSSKLQSHPQPMIAWICIAEACMSYNALMEVLNPVMVICYLSSWRIFGFTLGKPMSTDDDKKRLVNRLCQSNQIFYSFFQLISLMLNLCLCIDLILTIYDPFSPAYRRTAKYYFGSITASFILVMVIFGMDAHINGDTDSEFDCIDNTKPD